MVNPPCTWKAADWLDHKLSCVVPNTTHTASYLAPHPHRQAHTQTLCPLLLSHCVFLAGLFNTLYYTVAFVFVWFTVANVPSGVLPPSAVPSPRELTSHIKGSFACMSWFCTR